MIISGELVNTHILVKKSSDIGRLYNKSYIGTLCPPDRLFLDLFEGIFLLDEGKMKLYENKKEVTFPSLLKLAVQHIPEFETKYLVFKDLRSRGHAISLCETSKQMTFQKIKKQNQSAPCFVVTTFSERDLLDIDITKQSIDYFKKKNTALWYALVDEEGDLTYYDVSGIDLAGKISINRYPQGTGILLKNRLIIFDKNLADQLLSKEFFGKPFGGLLQLSFVEALYLLERKVLEIQTIDGKSLPFQKCLQLMEKLQPDIEKRLAVFKDLKQRGLLVKTGFKFGAHFRVYTKRPEKTHAEYLVHVVEKGYKSIWAEISRAVRLAHSVNKEFVFAYINGNSIDYIKLGRLRP